jgi:hypothetical protein
LIVPSHFQESDLIKPDFYRSDFHNVGRDVRDEMVSHNDITLLDPQRSIYRYTSRKAAIRGFSEKFGDYISRIRDTEMGRLFVSEIKRRPMESNA